MLSPIGIAFIVSAVNPAPQIGGCTTASFAQSPGSPHAVGDAPFAVAVGDFDRDGAPDIAVVNNASDSVTIRWGDGAGGFATASTVAVGDAPVSVTIADFDRDGALDFATANQASGVTIRFGDGAGEFPDAGISTISGGTLPMYVATGDFDRDGAIDLAIVNRASNDVTIRLGDGAGAFPDADMSTIAVGSSPRMAAVGDLNGDGDLDLAIANFESDNVTIRYGDGTGAFPIASSLSYPADNPTQVMFADFIRGGRLELVVVSQPDDVFPNENVKILCSDGSVGGVVPCVSFMAPVKPFVEVADFNADSNLDLAILDIGSNTVTLRLGDGAGGFPPENSSSFETDNYPWVAAAGDFNVDGKADLILGNIDSDDVTVHLNTCSAVPCSGTSFEEPPGSPLASGWTSDVAFGDFNRDGHVDLAIENFTGVIVRYGDGTGAFPSSILLQWSDDGFPMFTRSVAVADLNRDGRHDLVVGGDLGMMLWFGSGGGVMIAFAGATDIAVGDFDRDGDPDLASMDFGSVDIRLGDGSGAFWHGSSFGGNYSRGTCALAVADFDLDGALDLAIGRGGNAVTIRFGNGQGGFPAADSKDVVVSSSPVAVDPKAVVVGDFNRDGKPDFAAALQNAGGVTIRMGDGQGNFPDADSTTISTASGPFALATGDLNVDGKLDLAISHRSLPEGNVPASVTMMVLIGDGSGGFPEVGYTTVLPVLMDLEIAHRGTVAIADLDGNGRPDITAVTMHNGVTVHLNTCPSNQPPVANAGPTQTVECAGATTQVTLDGSQSTDEEGELDYSWSVGGTEIATGASPTVSLASGSHTITLTVTDSAGGTSSDDVTVHVVDTAAPTVTLVGGTSLNVGCHTSFSDPGATASDACAGALSVSTLGSVNVNTPGVYTISYSATDGTHSTTATRTVTVVDTTAPVITPSANVITLGAPNHKYVNFNVSALASSASDGCDSAIDLSDVVISSVSSDEPADGAGDGNTLKDIVIAANCKSVGLRAERSGTGDGRVYTVTMKVKDAAGNVGTTTRQVRVPMNAGGTAIDSGAGAGYTVSGCSP